jgi:hypothetical protein
MLFVLFTMSKILHMNNIDLATALKWVSLVLPLCAIAYKCFSIIQVRRKTNLYFPLRLISFYSDEQIKSTVSNKKRDYMKAFNNATIVIYAFSVPHLIMIAINLVVKYKGLLVSVF